MQSSVEKSPGDQGKVFTSLDLDKYIINFESVFSNKEISASFYKFLQKEFSSENYDFIMDFEKLCRHDSPEAMVRDALAIYDTYLADGAKCEVNVSGSQRERIFNLITSSKQRECPKKWIIPSTPSELYLDCAKTLKATLQVDSFKRYIQTHDFLTVIPNFVTDPTVATFRGSDHTMSEQERQIVAVKQVGNKDFEFTKQRGRVLYAFEPESDTQITVEAGDTVWIIDPRNDGWTEVFCKWNMKRGLIPTDYIEAEDVFEPLPPVLKPEQASKIVAQFFKWSMTKKRKNRYLATFGDVKQRNNLILEVLNSESTYVNFLNLFIQYFLKPLREKKILDETTVKKLFSNLEQIFSINKLFLTQLEKGMENFPQQQSFGNSVKNFAPFFRSYSTYVNNYSPAYSLYQQLEKSNPKFADFVAELYKHKDLKGQKFGSLLIMPVQRLPRYRMLFEQILKYTPIEHVERANIEDAVKQVAEVASFVNTNQRLLDNQKSMVAIAQTLKERIPLLVQPYRQYLREASVKILLSDRKMMFEAYKVYLFSDMVLMIDEANIKNLKKATMFTIMLTFSDLAKTFNPREVSLRCFNEKAKKFVSIVFESEEEAGAWEQDIRESLTTIQDFLERKEIQDPIKGAIDQVKCKNALEENRMCLIELVVNYDKARSQLFNSEKDIITMERQVEELKKQIQKDKERKAQVESEMLFLNEKYLLVKKKNEDSFEKLIEEMMVSDALQMMALRSEIPAFQSTFSDEPYTHEKIQDLFTKFPDLQLPLEQMDRFRMKKPLPEPKRKSRDVSLPLIIPRPQTTVSSGPSSLSNSPSHSPIPVERSETLKPPRPTHPPPLEPRRRDSTSTLSPVESKPLPVVPTKNLIDSTREKHNSLPPQAPLRTSFMISRELPTPPKKELPSPTKK